MLLERAQHKFTRMIYGMKSFDYEERLRMLNLWSLEEGRNRADLIEVFKSLRGLSAPSSRDLFTVSTNHVTRGHTLKLERTVATWMQGSSSSRSGWWGDGKPGPELCGFTDNQSV